MNSACSALTAAANEAKQGGLHFGCHDHYAVDGGQARIILEVLVTPADVMENQPFLDMLWRFCFRWQLRPDQGTGDTTYGTAANFVAGEDQGIRAYVPPATRLSWPCSCRCRGCISSFC